MTPASVRTPAWHNHITEHDEHVVFGESQVFFPEFGRR
jgi:hypothetical protein